MCVLCTHFKTVYKYNVCCYTLTVYCVYKVCCDTLNCVQVVLLHLLHFKLCVQGVLLHGVKGVLFSNCVQGVLLTH